ncbi:MAG: STAS domain-containing protein [Verrucomicrobia bacterium]|nr:STAS domain-containing protein [Verrucomicrobiota bacterium]
MTSSPGSLFVCIADQVVVFKVAGRASFTISADFKRVVHEMLQRGYRKFLLDLSECLIMDSTFLGVLAGAGSKLSGRSEPANGGTIELLCANARIADLLENLGVASLFKFISLKEARPQITAALQLIPIQATREETSRTCLEAHLTLMNVNPANVPRFKDVTKFIAEDLEKIKNQQS